MNPDARFLVRLFLIVLLMVSASCARSVRPERRVYVVSEDARRVGSELGTGGSGAEAYCGELQKQCFQACWRRKPSVSSIRKHSGKHFEHCEEKCLQEFMACVKKQEELERQDARRELRFSSMPDALTWLREHQSEVVLGTVVVVAGVGFALVVVPAGLLVLSPI